MKRLLKLVFVFLILATISCGMIAAVPVMDTAQIKLELRQLDRSENDWSEKETAARDLIRKSTEIGYTEGVLHASYMLATSYFFRQQYQQSWGVLDTMLLMLENSEKNFPAGYATEDKKARIYSFMGMIFDEIGDYNRAMEYYLKALKTVEPFGDDFQKAVLYKNIGMTNLVISNLPVASDYFKRALAICEKTGDRKTVFDIYNSLQSHFADSADYEQALQYGLKMLDIARESADDYSMCLANNALGHIYLAWDKKMLAEGFLLEAKGLSENNHYETILAQVLTGLASLKLSAGNTREAMNLADRAMVLAEKNDILSLKSQAALTLANVFEALANHQDALKYYKLYESSVEDENRNKSARSVLELQARYEMDKIHQEKTALMDQLHVKQYQVSKRNYILSATMIILGLLLALLLVVVKRYKHVQMLNRQLHEQQMIIGEQEKQLHEEKERSLNLEIEHKNRELTSIAMSLGQENEFKQHLVELLEQLKSSLGPLNRQEIKNVNMIISSIKQNMSTNAWEEFRTYFDNVYSTFYEHLKEQFPGLSQSEQKLCAMLKLGLSTKEISMLTYREIKSVESARNRLRRKMNLDPKINLQVFLSQF